MNRRRGVKITQEQLNELEELSKPLIKYLNENYNPHTIIIVDFSSAEIFESNKRIVNLSFIKD